MAPPRQALNPATNSVGFTAKTVTVQSLSEDGLTAITVDRQRVQVQVPMLVQRSKGPLPAPGETWVITQDLGMWSFAAFAGKSLSDFATGGAGGSGSVSISAQPPPAPATGDIWLNSSAGNEVNRWSGSQWVAAQFGTAALADGAVTAPKIAAGTITSSQIAPAAGITSAQVAFRASDIGGSVVSPQPYPPASPVPGQMWINGSNGNSISVWNGNAWIQLLFGAAAILPGSLTTGQLSPVAGITAGQVNFTASDVGGITTTLAAAPPDSPSQDDLWFDATNGYALRQWDGTTWVPYQFGTQAIQARSVTAALIAAHTITAGQIAAGTITAGQIAAGTITAEELAADIVVAGIVDGTIIEGAQFIAHGASGEILVYSGTPAANNLLVSISAPTLSGQVDAVGNTYLPGIVVYQHTGTGQYAALQLLAGGLGLWTAPDMTSGSWTTLGNASLSLGQAGAGVEIQGGPLTVRGEGGEFGDAVTLDATTTPPVPLNGVTIYGNSSGELALRGTDGNVYVTGRRVISFTGTQTVSSATFITVTDGTNTFAATVAAMAYKFRAMIVYEPSGTTGNANFELTSPASSSCGATFRFDFNGMTSDVARYDNASGFGNAQVGPTNLAIGTTVFCTLIIEGTAVFTASGTFAVKADTGAGSNFVIQKGSFFELEPM